MTNGPTALQSLSYTYDPARPHIVDNTNLGSYEHDAVGNQMGRPGVGVEYTVLDLPRDVQDGIIQSADAVQGIEAPMA